VLWDRAYQSVKAEIVSTSPATQASRPPSAQKPVCGRADEDLLVDLDERLLLGRREGRTRASDITGRNSCPIWFQITTARPTLTQSTATKHEPEPEGREGLLPSPILAGRGA